MRKLKNEELGRKSISEFKKADKMPVIIVLDNVRSLHNVGSIFRTCDAMLVETLFLCGITATPPHRELYKTALGAENAVNWEYFKKTEDAVRELKANHYSITSIEQTERSISLETFTIEKKKKYAFIFGNEVKGVQQEIVNISNQCVEIPQFGTKHSFNIAISAGIVLWEFFRQKNKCIFV